MRASISWFVLFLCVPLFAGNPNYKKEDFAERLGLNARDLLDPATVDGKVKAAVKKAREMYHPDKNPHAPEGSFSKVEEASKHLKDPYLRKAYLKTKGLVEQPASPVEESEEEFFESQVAQAFERLRSQLEENIRVADMEALQNSQPEDRDVFYKKALLKLLESYESPPHSRRELKIVSLPHGRKLKSATPTEWERRVAEQALAEFWEDQIDLLFAVYVPAPSLVFELCRKLDGIPIWSVKGQLVQYALTSGMEQSLTLDFFDQYLEQWIGATTSSYDDREASAIVEWVKYRQARFKNRARAVDFYHAHVESIFTRIKNQLKQIDSGSLAASALWLKEGSRGDARQLGMYLRLLERQSPKAALEFSMEALERVLPSHADELFQNAKAAGARIHPRLRQERPREERPTPGISVRIIINNERPAPPPPEYVYSEQVRRCFPEQDVEALFVILQDVFSRSLFRLMERNSDFVAQVLANPILKDHLFNTYLKADPSSEAGRACPAAVVAQIRKVQRPPKGLPSSSSSSEGSGG